MSRFAVDFAYFFVRIPTALAGVGLIAVSVAPTLEELNGSTAEDYLLRVVMAVLGLYMLIPNHIFISIFAYRFRLVSAGMMGCAFLWFGINLVTDYLGGGKDFAMIEVATAAFYTSVAFPISVWLRTKTPDA